nr:leucine-rich repeat protein [Ruminococcus sp.]
MKKIISVILSLAMSLTVMVTPWGESVRDVFGTSGIEASAETLGDYQYELLNNGTVIITYYNGSASSLSIPSTVNGKKVTHIGPCAFMNCKSLTSVTIPNGVTDIDYAAFIGCTSLKSVKIPASVKNISSYAFYSCFNLKNITLPTNVKSVGELAFGDCWSLSSISIPKSVSDIGDLAFGYQISDYDEVNNVIYYIPITSFKIKCYANTKGEDYAEANGFVFSYLDTLPNVAGFKASATSANAIKLTWNKTSGADGYIVYRYNTLTNKYERIAKDENIEFTDKNLAPGISYQYAVRAYKTVDGKEVLSKSYPEITAVTNPADVTGFTASSTSESTIKLTWNKTSGADGYIVYRYNTLTNKYERIAKGGNLEFTDKDLAPGTS